MRTVFQVIFWCFLMVSFNSCYDSENYNKKDSLIKKSKRIQYQEAPILQKRVEAGELPPVHERLPEEPLVLDVRELGNYGGSLGGGTVIQDGTWKSNN